MSAATELRRAAERRGRVAEWLAAWTLRLKGYRILAHGFRSPVGEIDLVARRGRTLVFIEVKARGQLVAAAEALAPRQRQRIARAALAFLQRHSGLAELDIRFDVLWVLPWRLPRHLVDAWRPET